MIFDLTTNRSEQSCKGILSSKPKDDLWINLTNLEHRKRTNRSRPESSEDKGNCKGPFIRTLPAEN